jgi:hypothetical protein
MVRANAGVLRATLFSALGLLPLACGGAFSKTDGGEAGNANAGTSSGGSKASGGKSGGNGFPCEEPVADGSGYERCKNGSVHRVAIQTCESLLSQRAPLDPSLGGDCQSDADCTNKPSGYCRAFAGLEAPGNYCAYGCLSDADCTTGSICLCGDPIGTCVSATCASDADCGAGLRCQRYESIACGGTGFACQTPDDQCGSNADCAAGRCTNVTVGSLGKAQPFSCQVDTCIDGRPFLVDGLARLAPVAGRADWLRGCELDLSHASVEQRQAAGQAWCRIGQMEHASVAAFARFALQLLSLGAPPELVEATTQAMADETRHARLAFAVASALLGGAVGPGALDVDRSLLETSLLDVTRLVIREGCFGETCAALAVREAALSAVQPELAQLLHGVADDETRHAELAWRFVGYALRRAPEQIASLLRTELDQALADQGPSPAAAVSADELALSAYGIVSHRLRSELRIATLREVIAPCVAALLRRAAVAAAENQVLSA